MELKIDLPADVFDDQFPEAEFRARVRELAILDLVRSGRLHEHEALAMLEIGRRELIEKMKAQGFAPTEDLFNQIRGELDQAIAARRKP
jgi:DNA-binding NtrC family response regulator